MEAYSDGQGGAAAARAHAWPALLACLLWALAYAPAVSMERSMGWDESMHAQAPAVHMLLAAQAGDWRGAFDELVLDHRRYPFGAPLALALVQSATGVSERAARGLGRALWALAAFGLFLVVRRAAEPPRPAGREPAAGRLRNADLAPWIALALCALSPLAIAYSGTLFLEVPFAAAMAFALLAWIARARAVDSAGAAGASGASGASGAAALCTDLLAGALVALAFFTKFNYGGLLAAALGLDLLCQGLVALRRGAFGSFAARALAVSAVPAAALAWWFVWPWPAGAEAALLHREGFAAFMTGNLHLGRTAWADRAMHALGFLFASPRLALLVLAAALLSLPDLRGPRAPHARALWLVLLVFAGGTLAHDFHEDRFFVPIAVPLAALAALGLARAFPRSGRGRAAAAAALSGLALAAPGLDAELAAERLGLVPADPGVAQYVRERLAEARDLAPWRPLPTAGLSREAHDALLDGLAAALGPDEDLGWVCMSSELSVGAVQGGLLARGGSPARYRRNAGLQPGDMMIDFRAEDPLWSDARLAEWAARFDAIAFTEPIDVKDRPNLRYMGSYRDRLLGLGWTAEPVASAEVREPLQPARQVRLFLARRAQPGAAPESLEAAR